MEILNEKVEEEWETERFQEYLSDKRNSANGDIAEAIEYIDKQNRKLS